MDKLAADLRGASTVMEKDLKNAYRWAIGKEEDTPNAKPLSNKEKAEFMQFSAWAAERAQQSNRAKEPGYVRELAKTWRMEGETASGIFPGYGRDKQFREAMKDESWLPELAGDDKQRIDALFAANPETAQKWAAKFGDNMEYGKRGYFKQETLTGLGKRTRSGAGGTE